MCAIVHRYFRIDGEGEPGMSRSQGAFDTAGTVAAGKDEPEIARSFRQGHEHLIGLGRDADIVHAGNLSRLVDAVCTPKHSAPRIRDSGFVRGSRFAVQDLRFESQIPNPASRVESEVRGRTTRQSAARLPQG